MTDEKLTKLLRLALLDHGNEGENALRILRKTCDPHRVRIIQEKGRVRQCGVNSGVASGRHFQAAFGVICSG